MQSFTVQGPTVTSAVSQRMITAQRGVRPFQAAGKCLRAPRTCSVTVRASTEQQAAPASSQQQQSSSPPRRTQPVAYVTDNEFSISKISFGAILTPIGLGLLGYGFAAYFQLLPGADVSSVMLIYGFPISILGFALNYAQLKPVPCKSTTEAVALRSSQMTDIQKQVREDVTRYRYGDEQHLDEALKRIFRIGRQGGISRKQAPLLIGLREEVLDGAYTLVLEFESKLEMDKWEEFQPKIQSFFGPGVEAILGFKDKVAEVYLKCDGSGAGRGGKERKDVLPPLMPGLPARQQD